jgi:DoxX-like family
VILSSTHGDYGWGQTANNASGHIKEQTVRDGNLMKESLMQSAAAAAPIGRARLWTGRALSGLAVVFLAFDSVVKVLCLPAAVEATTQLGYPNSVIVGLGVLELGCLAAYVIPRTAIPGAILMTGYLGGALASQLRVGNPLFTHLLFPVYVAALIWGGLFLRDRRVKALVAPQD